MDKMMITRRTAAVGVLMAIVTVNRAIAQPATAPQVSPDPAPPVSKDDPAATQWGSDGTREALSQSLGKFFDNETGSYIAVRKQDRSRVQANGEFLLADQLRLPLFGTAREKRATADGYYFYDAYIHRDPYVRIFLKADRDNDIIAAALADSMDIKKDGLVIGVVPRVTVFYRTPEPPLDLLDEAVKCMKKYYSLFSADTSDDGYQIHVFTHRLPSES